MPRHNTALKQACSFCGSNTRPLVLDLDGDPVCEDDSLCGTSTRKPPVTTTVLPTAPRLTLGQLSDAAEAAALELLVSIRRSRREGHRETRAVVEAQDRSRTAALDYHRATRGGRG